MTRTYKKQLPGLPPETTIEWTYWISRDTDRNGVLSDRCSLWFVKPLRTRIGERVTWTSAHGFLGNFRPDEIITWQGFHTYPETHVELIRVETRPTKKELEEQRKAAKFT